MQLYNYYISASTVKALHDAGDCHKGTICGLPYTHCREEMELVELPADAEHVYTTDIDPIVSDKLW
jgi:hypothetical protein